MARHVYSRLSPTNRRVRHEWTCTMGSMIGGLWLTNRSVPAFGGPGDRRSSDPVATHSVSWQQTQNARFNHRGDGVVTAIRRSGMGAVLRVICCVSIAGGQRLPGSRE